MSQNRSQFSPMRRGLMGSSGGPQRCLPLTEILLVLAVAGLFLSACSPRYPNCRTNDDCPGQELCEMGFCAQCSNSRPDACGVGEICSDYYCRTATRCSTAWNGRDPAAARGLPSYQETATFLSTYASYMVYDGVCTSPSVTPARLEFEEHCIMLVSGRPGCHDFVGANPRGRATEQTSHVTLATIDHVEVSGNEIVLVSSRNEFSIHRQFVGWGVTSQPSSEACASTLQFRVDTQRDPTLIAGALRHIVSLCNGGVTTSQQSSERAAREPHLAQWSEASK
mgnify:CR=1 FL=1